jgi:DNA helicase HerA-like ATPase
MTIPSFHLGSWRSLNASETSNLDMAAHHLVTHGVVVGMTGSGKTGLVTVMVEEALRSKVPVLVIDVKGDLPNLLLTFPRFDKNDLVPWLKASQVDDIPVEQLAETLNEQRRHDLESWSITENDLQS